MRFDFALAAGLLATTQAQTTSFWGDPLGRTNLGTLAGPASQTPSWPLKPPTSFPTQLATSARPQESSQPHIPWILRGAIRPTNSSVSTPLHPSRLNVTGLDRHARMTSSTFMTTPVTTASSDGAFTTDAAGTATSAAHKPTSSSGAGALLTRVPGGGLQSVWLGSVVAVAIVALQL
ncbi:hypothetical protein CDD80_4933 [Ophiocordyceps camponoti-rufipedis]|uniref:Uncharacterized protein n=1 Tax=Ophiocordyceps camponoti-rufipedis TaxID=2004952 RepID=A0A2C5ZIX4_9HYPO|nr:hypothetical protein CDD80_4933 [Ophiocordyceps camponoti-rufipedis]